MNKVCPWLLPKSSYVQLCAMFAMLRRWELLLFHSCTLLSGKLRRFSSVQLYWVNSTFAWPFLSAYVLYQFLNIFGDDNLSWLDRQIAKLWKVFIQAFAIVVPHLLSNISRFLYRHSNFKMANSINPPSLRGRSCFPQLLQWCGLLKKRVSSVGVFISLLSPLWEFYLEIAPVEKSSRFTLKVLKVLKS